MLLLLRNIQTGHDLNALEAFCEMLPYFDKEFKDLQKCARIIDTLCDALENKPWLNVYVSFAHIILLYYDDLTPHYLNLISSLGIKGIQARKDDAIAFWNSIISYNTPLPNHLQQFVRIELDNLLTSLAGCLESECCSSDQFEENIQPNVMQCITSLAGLYDDEVANFVQTYFSSNIDMPSATHKIVSIVIFQAAISRDTLPGSPTIKLIHSCLPALVELFTLDARNDLQAYTLQAITSVSAYHFQEFVKMNALNVRHLNSLSLFTNDFRGLFLC